MDELKIKQLQEVIEYTFNDINLLVKSMTHSSYANEKIKKTEASNERLEFLGDSLLGMTIALLIFNIKPELSEGKMTKLRAELVNERSLAEVAAELDLGSYLLLGRGEINGGGRSRPSILSDAFEALIAAMYLDGGYKPVESLIFKLFTPRVNNPDCSFKDYKTELQELIQGKSGLSLAYAVTSEHGPDHNKVFTVEVKSKEKLLGTGTGKSKKLAEQSAAKSALEFLGSCSLADSPDGAADEN